MTEELTKWPSRLLGLIQSPRTHIPTLPTTGSWLIPLTYSATAGLLAGLITILRFVSMTPSFALPTIVSSLLASVVGVFVAGTILNFVLGAIGTDPKLYRTIYFVAVMSGLGAVGAALIWVAPILSWAPIAAYLYVLYHYAQIAASCTKKQAGILIAVLAVLTLFSGAGMLGLTHKAVIL